MLSTAARTGDGRQGLAALLRDPGHALIAVDYDGTLAPIVDDPAAARPHERALPTLARLSRVVAQVAVVTGRPVRALLEVAGLAGQPGLERLVALGLYGHQRWDAASGQIHVPPPSDAVREVRAALPGVLADVRVPAGVRVEDKGGSLAVHLRGVAGADAVMALLWPRLERLAADNGLVVEPGRLVLELREPGADKGDAVRSLVAPDTSALLYCGDDLGDLAAFVAVEQLRLGGVPGVTVAAASPEADQVGQRADLVVDGVPGMIGFLEELAGQLERAAG